MSAEESRHRESGDLCVARVPLFQGLTYDEQLDVASVARPTQVDKDEQIYAAGSTKAQLMVVHTGRVKISRLSADGHEQIVRVLGPGDFVGESAFITGARPDHFAVALEPGSMCVFQHADLGRLIQQHPSVGLRMLQAVSKRLDQTEQRLSAAVSVDVSARLADYLLGLPARHTDGAVEVTLPLAKKDVASLIGTTPESFSRALTRLKDQGLVRVQADRVVLLDPDRLDALVAQA